MKPIFKRIILVIFLGGVFTLLSAGFGKMFNDLFHTEVGLFVSCILFGYTLMVVSIIFYALIWLVMFVAKGL